MIRRSKFPYGENTVAASYDEPDSLDTITKSEAIFNTLLVNFCNLVVNTNDKVWFNAEQTMFTLDYLSNGKFASCFSRVDGIMLSNDNIIAILEVKAEMCDEGSESYFKLVRQIGSELTAAVQSRKKKNVLLQMVEDGLFQLVFVYILFYLNINSNRGL